MPEVCGPSISRSTDYPRPRASGPCTVRVRKILEYPGPSTIRVRNCVLNTNYVRYILKNKKKRAQCKFISCIYHSTYRRRRSTLVLICYIKLVILIHDTLSVTGAVSNASTPPHGPLLPGLVWLNYGLLGSGQSATQLTSRDDAAKLSELTCSARCDGYVVRCTSCSAPGPGLVASV